MKREQQVQKKRNIEPETKQTDVNFEQVKIENLPLYVHNLKSNINPHQNLIAIRRLISAAETSKQKFEPLIQSV